MKKKIILLMTLAVFALAGCSSSTPTASTDSAEVEKLKSQIEKLEQENAELKEQLDSVSQEKQEDKETADNTTDDEITDDNTPIESASDTIEIGAEGSLGDWTITALSSESTDSVPGPGGFGSFSPDDGNKYFLVPVSITNNGKSADTFLPSFALSDDVQVKLLYGDGYEFSATQLLGSDTSLENEVINPLSSKEGELTFEIPDSIASSDDELTLHFTMGKEILNIKVR